MSIKENQTEAKKTDWINEWFRARRDCGEDISIVYAQIKGGKGKIQWYEMPHDRFDGIGWLVQILREIGCKIPPLPVLDGDRFSVFRALKGMPSYLPTSKLRRQGWKSFNRMRRERPDAIEKRIAYHLFSENETKQILSAAKKENVTVNSFLLYHLDRAVSEQLVEANASRRWMIAVNLRGAVERPTELASHLSFLALDLQKEESMSALHEKILRLRKRGYHWAAWLALQGGGKLFGAAGIRKYLQTMEEKNHGWTGTFSNLGVWNIPGAEHWLFCPNVSVSFPVGAGCISFNGRMAIALQLHEAFGDNFKTRQSVLDEWKGSIKNNIK